jgi:hypothetical protein
MILDVFESTGVNATSYSKGAVFYELLKKTMIDTHNITIDFTNVELVTSQFFNSTICLTLKNIDISIIQNRFKIIGLNEHDKALLNYTIQNAIEFYNKK